MHTIRDTLSLTILAAAALAACAREAGPPAEPAHVHFRVAAGADPVSVLAGIPGADVAVPLFDRPADALRADRTEASAHMVAPAPDLTRWYRIAVPPSEAEALASALGADPGVSVAFVEPIAEPASITRAAAPPDGDACPIRTPSYEPYQGYLSVAPAGIDAPAAWSRAGGRGEGVWFADVEGGWNATHEDLPGDRIRHVHGRQGDRGWTAHGTAVLGEVVGRDNGLGVVGIAPGVERVFTSSIVGSSVAAAIDAAQSSLRPGDVLLIELHSVGPRGRWLPMEFWDDVWDVIRVATARGVVVVEAAGNGGEDLDHPAYDGKLDRRRRDSGAIVVGAGAPARQGFVDRSRLDFSNYGSRVDVQGWGRRVATLDYGDLQRCSEAHERDYTDQFSGTSSASPVVTGAAVLLQGVARAERGAPLDPIALRTLLASTGSPQTDGPHGDRTEHIGPRPDLARALSALDRTDGGAR